MKFTYWVIDVFCHSHILFGRKKKSWFSGEEAKIGKPRTMSSTRIADQFKDFVKRKWNAEKNDEIKSLWKKRTIFFELPYWQVTTKFVFFILGFMFSISFGIFQFTKSINKLVHVF